MNARKKWKKIKKTAITVATIIIAFVGIMSFMQTGEETKELNKIENKQILLTFENPSCNSTELVIHTFNDGRKIYSRCGNIYYGEQKIELSRALDNSFVTMEEITSKMEVKEVLRDGGTTVYEYDKNKETVAENSFKLEVCNKIGGSKDMLFLSNTSNNYKCA